MRLKLQVDPKRCIGCRACTVACKMEHQFPPYPTSPPQTEPKGPSFIRVFQEGPFLRDGRVEQSFKFIVCRQCTHPSCKEACPLGAIYQTQEGVLEVDRDLCTGCGLCKEACPIGAPEFLPDGTVGMCDLCLHRVRDGKEPMCVSVCPTRCLQVLEIPWVGTEGGI